MLCSLLLYNSVNQPYVCIYPLPLIPLSRPSRAPQSTQLSSLCYTTAPRKFSLLYMVVYICQCYTLDLPLPLLAPPCSQVCFLRLHLYSVPVNRFISAIFFFRLNSNISFLKTKYIFYQTFPPLKVCVIFMNVTIVTKPGIVLDLVSTLIH